MLNERQALPIMKVGATRFTWAGGLARGSQIHPLPGYVD
jgi:hypothetical protein